jgi:membrane associated rhomboid family serine protease
LFDRKPKNNQTGRPSVCRSCGAIVGAGQNVCAVCDAPLATAPTRDASAPAVSYDRETLRFARAVLSRPYILTIVFLISNFFVFLLMWHSSGMSGSALWVFPEPVLKAYGAKLNRLIDQGQWWRFVTPMFVHVNILHLLVNMYSLWMVGPYVEKLYGSAKFVFFWVTTGVAGVVASYLTVLSPGTPLSALGQFIFKTQDNPSAGASGAIFGLVGVLFVFGIKFRHELPEGFKRAFGTGLLPVIMINLFIGYMAKGFIDNAAHLGGLISGAALALVVSYRRPGERSSLALAWQVAQISALALVAVSFVRVAQHFRDPGSGVQVTETRPLGPTGKVWEFLTFAKAMNDALEVLQSAVKGDPNGVDAAVGSLEATTPPDIKADQLKRKLEALLQRAKQPEQSATPNGGRAAPKVDSQRSKLLSDFAALEKEYNDWLRTTGKQYGG